MAVANACTYSSSRLDIDPPLLLYCPSRPQDSCPMPFDYEDENGRAFEAPLFEERSVKVIEAIKEKFPDKPIRYTMMTHYHQDHSGGIRTYAAEGATIIAHSNIIPFVEGMLKGPKTINPDSLAGAEASSGIPTVPAHPTPKEAKLAG